MLLLHKNEAIVKKYRRPCSLLFYYNGRWFCKMKSFILLLSITSIVASNSPVYRQGDWNVRDENAMPQDNQFYEGFFQTRIDHFKPLNQTTTTFVSVFFLSYVDRTNFFIVFLIIVVLAIQCECEFLRKRRSSLHLHKRFSR